MTCYHAPVEDMVYLLDAVLGAPATLAALPAHAGFDAALMRQVLDEAGRFASEVVAPLNRSGDEVGARWHQGQVTMPPGFREAYQAFWRAGWPALAAEPADGGQGLPLVLEAVLYEMLSAANHGWTMAPGLLHGAYECLRHHGSESLKARYLGRIASGEWLATMCLTEPQAGSDLGLCRTRALPQADGSHRIEGTKIFISGGEHDLTDNIVHLVLARLPDAPSGPKGLSLFLVPKWLDGGARNPVVCERIEEKMGLHASPTCVLRFDAATGWLIGHPGQGLNAMFVMMNAARLHVALQGLGLLDAAWQKARAYAQERRQMRAPGARETSLIIEHAAVRRLLHTQRAWIDGGRVLAYRTAVELDLLRHHPEASRRAAAERWCALVTPVLKAAFTQQAFLGASDCLQVFGGHGYVREWGVEQHVRDARVTMIYEGTNEIQAIDLLVRKVLVDGGAALRALLQTLGADLDPSHPADAAALAHLRALGSLAQQLVDRCRDGDLAPAHAAATDFLHCAAVALLGWAWARIEAAQRAHASPVPESCRDGAAAFNDWVTPSFALHARMVAQACQSPVESA
ncbi:MAG: acyl-CoA dehydrogenase family protein [Burkholderiaceae bacterium]|nr:MAG: acyl-CoA dehydrogenase family protein [Burkholderiaceae bacterium]